MGAGLLLVYSAKTQNFPELSAALARGELLDLNRVSKPEQLLPFLQVFQDRSASARVRLASKMFDYLAAHRPLPERRALWRDLQFGAASAIVAAGEAEAGVRGAHAGANFKRSY